MIKMVNLLVRAEGWSHDEFVTRLRDEHVPVAVDLPGLEEYATAVPRDPERAAYDAVAELYFADSTALGMAFDGESGRAVQADAGEFADMEASQTLVVEEEVHVQR